MFVLVGSVARADDGAEGKQCAAAADQIVELVDEKKVDQLAGWFAGNVLEPPEYFRTWLTTLLREYGHLSDTKVDPEIKLEDFTELGMKSKDLEEPFEIYKYRTHYHHEGDGIIYVRLARVDGRCKIDYLVFGLPRSSPNALQRYYEIQSHIDDEMAAIFR
ncbi:MAG TPA: hypothetical protein ENJ16_02275 [Planctomycetaceae bacterium]|nr:hypothetical protein [Planctomycetaceae bacterium]